MHLAFNGTRHGSSGRRQMVRLSWVSAGGSHAFQLLQGCPVVTADGDLLGSVNGLMVDILSHRPRFVTLDSSERAPSCCIAIPWQALYFDSTLAHLVFYTYEDA